MRIGLMIIVCCMITHVIVPVASILTPIIFLLSPPWTTHKLKKMARKETFTIFLSQGVDVRH